ncbi:Porin P [Nitrosospira sp. NRS527]|nr:Porin P [Nitrosospira sp. NRS527]
MRFSITKTKRQSNRGHPIKFTAESINNILKCCALVVSISANVGWTHPFVIDTKGSPKIKTNDGNFEMVFGARAHLDVHSFDNDKADPGHPAFGSQVDDGQPRSGFNFRRGYTDVTARFYDLSLKFQNDFAAGTFPGSLREAWVAAKIGPGQLTVGQFKAYRGMEELTSSNETTMMERPSTSSTGIYAGRQWLMGVGYKGIFADQLGYAVNIMSLTHTGMPVKGSSYGGRLFWVPRSQEGDTLHFGFSYSIDTEAAGSLSAKVVDIYGGRRGFSQSFGSAGAAAGLSGHHSETTWALEAAYAIGPVNLQGEYAAVKLDNTHLLAGTQKDSHVQAYYVQASWFITGEKTIYRKERGAFGKPKPIRKWGAIELAARYDAVENKDQSLVENPCGTGTTKCQVQVLTLGVNWYVREGVRLMLNYYLTEAEIGNAGPGTPNRKDSPSVISFRTQLSF